MTDTTATKDALSLNQVEFFWAGRDAFGLTVPGFALKRGERVLLLGESGSGKSTLLSLICGINAAQRGSIRVDGIEMASMRAATRDRFRAEKIGIVFQQFNLLPYASPMDNILLPLHFAPERRARAGDARAAALTLTDALGLARDAVTSATADRLSVGQQQRVAVARALIGAPSLIIADEPTSALDAGSQANFLDLLFAQCAVAGSTLLMVSHDERLATRFDRSVSMKDIATLTRKAAA
ncbi:ATP-binding cassette domain-containing protein [Rhodobacteraceae bacterium LMO-12]|nr:ATP-binding cassette domain-containing protein [Rhodobacteraceae bacterium LMO-JJ12]